MSKKFQSGMTTVELIIASVLGAVVLFSGFQLFSTGIGGITGLLRPHGAHTSATSLHLHLMEVGRLSASCAKLSLNSVECQVNFTTPSAPTISTVRFEKVGETVEYKRLRGGVMQVELTYDAISNFVICDDNDFLNQTCPIGPQPYNELRRAALSGKSKQGTPAGGGAENGGVSGGDLQGSLPNNIIHPKNRLASLYADNSIQGDIRRLLLKFGEGVEYQSLVHSSTDVQPKWLVVRECLFVGGTYFDDGSCTMPDPPIPPPPLPPPVAVPQFPPSDPNPPGVGPPTGSSVPVGRFFRFKIVGEELQTRNNAIPNYYPMQGAFYVRHPPLPAPNMLYKWGIRE